jgi:toxin-antitoxin system PIN domain toxin
VSRVALLDVNVLVALFDPDHVHHDAAHDWFGANRDAGWATCPLTENGLVRILSNTAYSGVHEAPAAVQKRLVAFCASGEHVFWPDEVSLRDARRFRWPGTATHRHITDIYLLALATHKQGRLVTFDRAIPVAAVAGVEPGGHLEVIPA